MVLGLSRQVLIGILVLAAIGACSKRKKKTQADPEIKNSFSVVDVNTPITTPQGGALQKSLVIRKDALDKEFLLQASAISQIPNATSSALKSRIVAFKRVDDAVFLMEATQGHVITKDLPAQLILARFEILSETEQNLNLDFNQGMSAIFVSGDWSSSDEGAEYADSFGAVEIKSSFIESISFYGNALSIRQIAQVAGNQQDSVEIKYYLEPYQENLGYKVTPGADIRKLGFFEVAAQYQSADGSGDLTVYASKFDLKKPLIFAISENTPADYQQAVRDGILYWNRALPNSPIQVVVAPKGVTAPDFKHNIVQWVPWDSAGYAYADAQMDPRSGEILHAQVYMTSTFAVGGEAEAKALIESVSSKNKFLKKVYALSGLVQKPMCNFEMPENLVRALEKMLARKATEEEYLRISQDYVREVVAHEIGHTLGLRHNFAGSLGANYDLQQRQAIVSDYVTQQKVPDDLQPSSSVMEYQAFEESALTGHIIGKTQRMLDYDQKAMAALYAGKEFEMTELPVFCSDSDTNYLDCQTFDLGKNPVEFIAWGLQQEQYSVSQQLFDSILRAKQAGNNPSLKAASWASYFAANRYDLLRLLSDDIQQVQVRRNYTRSDDLTLEQIAQEESTILRQALDRNGGWNQLLALPHSEELKLLPSLIKQRMSEYTSVDQDGSTIVFSLDEQARFNKITEDFAKRLDQALQIEEWNQLGTLSSVKETVFTDDFLAWYKQKASAVLLTAEGTVSSILTGADGSPSELSLPAFVAQPELRRLAATAVSGLETQAPWKINAIKESIHDELEAILETAMPEAASIKYQDLDSVGQQWRENQQSLIGALGN